MKVYGAEICYECRNYKAIQKARGFKADYVEIMENTTNLKEFLALRDGDAFKEVRANKYIGIPCFVLDDGKITFDINEAFASIGQPPVREEEIVEKHPACNVNDKSC